MLLEATQLMQDAVIEALQTWSDRGGTVATTGQSSNEIESGVDDDAARLVCVVEDSSPDCELAELTVCSDAAAAVSDETANVNVSSPLLPHFPRQPQLTNPVVHHEQLEVVQHASISSLPKELWHSEQLERVHHASINSLPKELWHSEQLERVHHASINSLPKELWHSEQLERVHHASISSLPKELWHSEQLERVHHASISSLPKELWHSEQLEYFSRAIEWLERAINDFESFEKNWEERKLHINGRSRFTLPTFVFPGFL